MVQRHGNRCHTSAIADRGNDGRFPLNVAESNSTHTGEFTGPLDNRLNIYCYEMSESYLMGLEASNKC